MASNWPSSILIRVAGNEPEGLAVRLVFQMKCKNDFSTIAFVDHSGSALLHRKDLFDEFDGERELFLMDYGDPRTDFTGAIVGNIMTRQEIAAAIQAYEMFRDVARYEPRYYSKLAIAQGKDCDVGEYTLEIVRQF
ncbi:MAG: hypothetical protein U0570_03845 [Phycisphaerales bacterium]